MADVIFPVAAGVNKKLKDMGDGTYAETINVGGATLTSGDVTVDTEGVATAADPSYSEGTTDAAFSLDLAGYQRVRDKDRTAQNSTTSGQYGKLAQGATTTAAPSYTTAKTNPLSLDTHGALRGLLQDSAGAEVVGEVQASPTQYTLLDRLKTLATSLTSIIAALAGTLTTTIAGFSFTNITAAATTVVKSGAGVMHTLTINSLGTVASVTTVYDNTSATGTKIATIDSLNLRGTVLYDVAFSTGLTIVTTGTIAPDITVSWR